MATKTSGLKYFQKSVFEDVLMGAISWPNLLEISCYLEWNSRRGIIFGTPVPKIIPLLLFHSKQQLISNKFGQLIEVRA